MRVTTERCLYERFFFFPRGLVRAGLMFRVNQLGSQGLGLISR